MVFGLQSHPIAFVDRNDLARHFDGFCDVPAEVGKLGLGELVRRWRPVAPFFSGPLWVKRFCRTSPKEGPQWVGSSRSMVDNRVTIPGT
jgi:hypothetical protein